MNLRDKGTRLVYVISHETYYYRPELDENPKIWVQAAAIENGVKDGVAWEFAVVEYNFGTKAKPRPVLRIEMFCDAFKALTEIPEFFLHLSDDQISQEKENGRDSAITLVDVIAILDAMGAEDLTERERASR